MKSMTGYGSYKSSTQDLELEVNVKCVNGRFLDVRLHGPKEYAPFEGELKQTVSSTFRRGTVDVFILRRVGDHKRARTVTVRKELAKGLLKAQTDLLKELKIKAKPDIQALLNRPELYAVSENGELLKGEKSRLITAVKKALLDCDKERVREGKALKEELLKLLKELEKRVEGMESLRFSMQAEMKERLRSKLDALSEGLSLVDPQRLAQEVVLQLDKMDIAEEVARLKEHIRNCRAMMGSAAEGKKLDFYCQELLREVNTVGSKSQSAPLTAVVVEAKTYIEKLREQVQNVE